MLRLCYGHGYVIWLLLLYAHVSDTRLWIPCLHAQTATLCLDARKKSPACCMTFAHSMLTLDYNARRYLLVIFQESNLMDPFVQISHEMNFVYIKCQRQPLHKSMFVLIASGGHYE